MTKAFIAKVVYRCLVDTRKYRYYVEDLPGVQRICRIELYKLGTTAALTDRQIVREWRYE